MSIWGQDEVLMYCTLELVWSVVESGIVKIDRS